MNATVVQKVSLGGIMRHCEAHVRRVTEQVQCALPLVRQGQGAMPRLSYVERMRIAYARCAELVRLSTKEEIERRLDNEVGSI